MQDKVTAATSVSELFRIADRVGVPASQLAEDSLVVPASPADVLAASSDPEGGEHTVIATFESGDASCRIERYDYVDADGQLHSELGVLADWDDEGAGLAGLHLIEPNFRALDDLCSVLVSALRLIAKESPS